MQEKRASPKLLLWKETLVISLINILFRKQPLQFRKAVDVYKRQAYGHTDEQNPDSSAAQRPADDFIAQIEIPWIDHFSNILTRKHFIYCQIE